MKISFDISRDEMTKEVQINDDTFKEHWRKAKESEHCSYICDSGDTIDDQMRKKGYDDEELLEAINNTCALDVFNSEYVQEV